MQEHSRFSWWFQFRYERLGKPECPYLYRWTLVVLGYSVRLHHWIKSDDYRYFHDHPWDFVSIPLWGTYTNVTPEGEYEARPLRPWRFKAEERHWLRIPPAGAWTLLLCGRPYRKWGFWVNNHLWRPLRYFHKFGIIQDAGYQ